MSSFNEKLLSAKPSACWTLGINLPCLRRRASGLIASALLGTASLATAQTTIFSESMGTPSGTTAIATYATGSAPATFQNKATLTFTGTGDMRATGVSTGYAGASGTGNVFLTSPGPKDFQIAGINTTGYSSFTLSFGVSRSNVSQTLSELALEYSSDGTTYSPISVPAQTGATGWIKLTLNSLSLPATSNLRLRWKNTSTVASGGQQLRIDDVVLIGSAATDTTPPTVATLSPTNGATNVAAGTDLVANFSEVIAAGTGDIVITKTSDSSIFATIPVTDPQVSISGSTLTVNPTADLALGTDYNVQIAAGAVKDAAGNNFAGITNSTTWAFTTVPPDTTPPTIASTTPANSATGVIPTSSISVTFNEPVQTPFTAANFIVKKVSDNSVFATVSSSAFGTSVTTSGNTATITLPSALDYGTAYYVEIEPGAIEDGSSNPFVGYTGSATWSFTTVGVPALTTASPYTQDFSTFTSIPNLPLGWMLTGSTTTYAGTWSSSTSTGVLGNASVLGYQHTGSTNILVKTLTLRNTSGAPITDLVVSYNGRAARLSDPSALRDPFYTVTVNGTTVSALSYSTSNGDNVLRTASLSGLNIADGATFQIKWTSDGSSTGSPGTGSRRQIGISNVSVAIGVQQFAPTVTNSFSLATLTYSSATLSGDVTADGSSTITERGFVYAATATNAAPEIGGTGVTKVIDGSPGLGAYSAPLTGLTAATGYTFRAYAINGVGTSYGNAISFTTLVTPPTFTSSYSQLFAAYNGTNPAGWSAVSSGGAQGYAGAWGNTGGSAGFTGGDSSPGVLGYQHTGGTGTLTTTLTLINGTGSTLDQLYISYLGRASRISEGRYPAFVVSVNGTPVTALAYSTFDNVDTTVSTTLTSLGIAPGAAFTISWVSDRGAGGGSSKQIGLTNVFVGLSAPAGYTAWSDAYAPGQAANLDHDFDGVPNGVEYFMGATGSTFTANPGVVAGAVTWTKGGSYTGVYGTDFVLQSSSDLATWTPIPSNDASLHNTAGSVSYDLPTTAGPFFVRLKVTP